jgi:hypothetical protein
MSRDRALPSRDRALPSRDREGAISLSLSHPHRHRLPLFLNDISYRCGNLVPIPQPTHTSVPRPTLAIPSVRAGLVQSAARIGFEIDHYSFWFRICFHHAMRVIRSNVRRQKCPLPMRANLLHRLQHCGPVGRAQQVRSLVHQEALTRCTLLIGLRQTMSRNVMVPIHGTGFVAVQMRSIARERNQIRHANLLYTAPSRSRLGSARSSLNGSARSSLNGGVRSSLNGSARSSLNGSARSSLNGSVRSSLNGSVRSSLNGGVRSSLDGRVRSLSGRTRARIGKTRLQIGSTRLWVARLRLRVGRVRSRIGSTWSRIGGTESPIGRPGSRLGHMPHYKDHSLK